jgi:hypothetical protein
MFMVMLFSLIKWSQFQSCMTLSARRLDDSLVTADGILFLTFNVLQQRRSEITSDSRWKVQPGRTTTAG